MSIFSRPANRSLSALKLSFLGLMTMAAFAASLPAAEEQSAPLIPNTGILHGFVTRQHGPPVSQLTAIVIQTEGAIPFHGEQAVDADGEFIFDPHPGTYLVELRDRKGKLVASQSGINIFSDITTFVFFDL